MYNHAAQIVTGRFYDSGIIPGNDIETNCLTTYEAHAAVMARTADSYVYCYIY